MMRKTRARTARLAAALVLLVTSSMYPADGRPTSAPTRVETTFGSWTVSCAGTAESPDAGDGRRRCSMVQTLRDRETGRTVVTSRVVAHGNGAPVLAIGLPLGVRLRPGLTLAAGKAEPVTVSYAFCVRRGCYATLALTEELRERLSSAERLQVGFVARGGRRVTVDLPLDGFADALAHLLSETTPGN